MAGDPWHFLLVSRLSASAPRLISPLKTSWSLQSRFRVRMIAPNQLATAQNPLSCFSHYLLLAQPKDAGIFLWKYLIQQKLAGHWPDGSVSKATYHQTSRPAVEPRDPPRRRERGKRLLKIVLTPTCTPHGKQRDAEETQINVIKEILSQ